MFKSTSPKKEECITPMKCITFDKEAQDNLPEHIKAKMKADRDNARAKLANDNPSLLTNKK